MIVALEHSLFVVGSAVNHDAEYLSTTGVEKVINACGKMTILGVSSVAPEVMQATGARLPRRRDFDALVEKTGELVSAIRVLKIAISPRAPSAGITSLLLSPTASGRVALMPTSTVFTNEGMPRGHNR